MSVNPTLNTIAPMMDENIVNLESPADLKALGRVKAIGHKKMPNTLCKNTNSKLIFEISSDK